MTLGPIPAKLLVNGSARYHRASRLTLIEAGVSFLPDHAAEGLRDALASLAVPGDVHLALDGDVRVGYRRGEQLADGAEDEGDGWGDVVPAPPLVRVLHLLEQGVLQDGVDDQHERGHDAAEERLRAFVAQQGHQGAEGSRLFILLLRAGATSGGLTLDLVLDLAPARGHAGVDDPDGVREDDGGGAGEGAGDHGLDRGQLLAGAAGAGGGGLEEAARPLVPVVVDEVGDADAEDGAVEPRVQARHALARDDLPHGGQERRLGSLRLDLRAGRQGDEGVSVSVEEE